MDIATLLARLEHVRRSRDGWMARCPAHDDRSPSLSLRESDGKILLHCFAGCTVEAICAAAGVQLSSLFSKLGTAQLKPRIVSQAERQVASLRNHLSPRERVLPITVIYCDAQNLDAGIARALALAVEGEIVQCLLEGQQ